MTKRSSEETEKKLIQAIEEFKRSFIEREHKREV